MPLDQKYYARSPEALLVGAARTGNRDAFAELVKRRQQWVRNLMRRCSGNTDLAEDLAQQVFLQAWRRIPQLQVANRFPAWLKRIAISTWLQHNRKSDPLLKSRALSDEVQPIARTDSVAQDLDAALAMLPDDVRLCIVLAYHEQMTHAEITETTRLPLGTTKSHIRRGAEALRRLLAAYAGPDALGAPSGDRSK